MPLCTMEIIQCQNPYKTITAVYCQFSRVNVHVIGQKAHVGCHLHTKFVPDSALSLAYHESCVCKLPYNWSSKYITLTRSMY